MTPRDWPAMAEIYRQGIESGDATFETEVPDWDSWDAARSPECRIVAEVDGKVAGYAGLSPVSKRPVYAGVREVMIYMGEFARGKGVGGRLLRRLVEETEKKGIWTLQAGIFPENGASIRIFEQCGFRVLGTHERLGRFHDGRWRDVVLMERRSGVAGIG
ncbi:MAG: GNAT family N-acetyltransferase [Gemmatimonadota bacterium]|nr:GNAT family N-acetyltransferase [Gemmatimonadota bacterium]MDE2985672.1 GNAT family N-acetyltransferase [Gemmatimonadota bacterium]